MRLVSLAVGFLFFVSSISAVAGPRVYFRSDNKTIYNNKTYEFGFWVPKLQDADEIFSNSPEAARFYQEHVSHAKTFAAFNWGALGAVLVYGAAAKQYNRDTALAVFAVPWIIGIVYAGKSQKALIKAFNVSNGVPSDQASLELTPPAKVAANSLQVPLWAWSF